MVYQFSNFAVTSDDPVAAVKEAAALLFEEWNQTHDASAASGYMVNPFTGTGQVAIEAVEYATGEIGRVFGFPARDLGLPVEAGAASLTGPLLIGAAILLGWLLFARKK